jgi:hypothetical protein
MRGLSPGEKEYARCFQFYGNAFPKSYVSIFPATRLWNDFPETEALTSKVAIPRLFVLEIDPVLTLVFVHILLVILSKKPGHLFPIQQ